MNGKGGLTKKRIVLELTEFDVELLLIALGSLQNQRLDAGGRTKPLQLLIDKVYRACGVRL